MIPRNRYERSVVESANTLHMFVRGSFMDDPEEMRELRDWLEWRVGEGWLSVDIFSRFARFEKTVRELARLAISQYDKLERAQ